MLYEYRRNKMLCYQLINNYINGVFTNMSRSEKHYKFLYYINIINHDFNRDVEYNGVVQIFSVQIFPKV